VDDDEDDNNNNNNNNRHIKSDYIKSGIRGDNENDEKLRFL
jgi:hypothetical protein